MKAAAASCWSVVATTNRAGSPSLARWRRARLASCRQASTDRPTMPAMSSNESWKTSCSTNAVRSAGVSRSSMTVNARRTESSRVTRSAGSTAGGGGDAVERCRAVGAVVEWFLALASGRAKLVQAQAADHGEQPRPHVVDLVEVGARQSDERLLDDVLGLTEVAEHAQRDVEDVPAMLPPCSPERRLEFAWLVAIHEEMTIGRPAM